jgi:glucose-6-phosphate isomerase
VTQQLQIEGVKLFAESYDKLIESTQEKVKRLQAEEGQSGGGTGSQATHLAARQSASLGPLQSAVDEMLQRADREHFARQVWTKNPSFWKPNPQEQHEITDRLGWLTVTEQMRDALPRLHEVRDDVKQAGFKHAVLLGMGGSSLAPEVLEATFGSADGQPKLLILDTTDPETIAAVEQQIDLAHTVFIVASKSGGTLETMSHYRYFFRKVRDNGAEKPGAQFIAITDPGTRLDKLAQDNAFRHIFRNPADIGGRYSALSFFGLVPAAIIGLDIEKLLDRADCMQQACDQGVPVMENPGLWLGVVLGTATLHGRNKATVVASPPISTFGNWVEQLIAESTGKEGKGIVPVVGETLGGPDVYGDDRLFVYLRTKQQYDPEQDQRIAVLEKTGHPVVTLHVEDTYDLGEEFFRWEFAIAIAGALLGINAFDQPNVQESKDVTDALLADYGKTGKLAEPGAVLRTESGNVSLVAPGQQAARFDAAGSLQEALDAFVGQAKPGDYIALLAYVQRTGETEAALEQIRIRLRDRCRVATTMGYGPRFQHSTGQLHKGGPNTGLFIQFVAQDQVDRAIPDVPYTFATLKAAQALGDLQTLERHGRRVIRLDLDGNIAVGLREVQAAASPMER